MALFHFFTCSIPLHVRSAVTGPVGALLEQTTLGEFMAAVESVRRKSHLELPGAGVERSASLRVDGGGVTRHGCTFFPKVVNSHEYFDFGFTTGIYLEEC